MNADVALGYVKAGICPLPVSVKTKEPIIKWKKFQDRLPTETELKQNLRRASGLAMVTGAISGNLETLDYDFKAELFPAWSRLVEEEAPGLLSQLVMEKSQNQGIHVSYRCPEVTIPGNEAFARRLVDVSADVKRLLADGGVDPDDANAVKKAIIKLRVPFGGKEYQPRLVNGKFIIVITLIESRGEGGYFLAHPTPGYVLIQGDFFHIPVITANERQILINAAIALNEYVDPGKIEGFGYRLSKDSRRPGDDFSDRGDVTELLAKHEWLPVGRNGVYQHYVRPGKARGISASLIGGKVFRVFTTNGFPFEAEKSYSLFAVYAFLEHDGDFVKAASKLAKLGYGEKPKTKIYPLADDGAAYDQAPQNGKAAPTQGTCQPPTSAQPAPLVFPDAVMTGAAGRFARTYAEYLETPACFLYMGYLTILGHVICDRITLKSEISPQCRLFTVLLGESADVRKSTSISKAYGFFKDTISADDLNVVWGAGSGEGLAKSFKKNNRVLLLLDELKAIIQKMRIESSSLLPCVNTMFESNIFHNFTKKKTIAIDDGHLCMLAASTLDTYQNMFTGTFTDIGFINRLFIIIGDSERKFSIPEQIPQEIKTELKQDLRNVLGIVGEHSKTGPWAFSMHSTARDIFDAWYFQLKPSIFAKRLDTYGHRLMPLLAVNEGLHHITLEIAEKTIALLDYQLEARKLADPIECDNKIARLEETIRRKLACGPLSKRELERAVNKRRAGVWAFDAAIKNLRDDHQVFFDAKKGIYQRVAD